MNRLFFAVTAAVLLMLGLTSCSELGSLMGGETRDGKSGEIIKGGNTDALELRNGDCFNDLPDKTTDVASVPTVPCTEPHDYQVFHTATLDNADKYPGDDSASEQAYALCESAFTSFVGSTPGYDVDDLYPNADGWAMGERTVSCLLTKLSGPSTGAFTGTTV
ncbi:septum formation family protein [Rathayibacter toxicus]|nr:septum formation family protein [Rathayibacter toxicus]AJM77028.1 hypothetical protein TI83_01695 [Rathayibacter toxicus]ALS57168.1 hypothetical protein APU90_04795 [Rathayibacter toxicus]KKM46027.1 hypothetical protein VT73_02710 [Rathayibacter toxicus]QOD08187.1 septum formation family protein [Rathayibacter toxicus]QOD10285.1 septum formation family protein [Rathayibacter toxicus]